VTGTIDTDQPGHAGTLTVRDRHAVQRVEQARPACWPARGQCRGEYVAHGLNEAVLRREVGGPDVMRDQARWLVEVATLPTSPCKCCHSQLAPTLV
jgi:hypothetical protein